MELMVETRELIALDFNTDQTDPVVIEALDIQFAVIPGTTRPTDADFVDASDVNAVGDNGSPEALLLVGDGTDHELGALDDDGNYQPHVVYARIQDNPEIPWEPVGVILPY